MDHEIEALVIAGSAQLRDSLLVLLRAIPHVTSVYQADNGASALGDYPNLVPDLVLLDYVTFPEEASTTIRDIKLRWTDAQCVALVDDEHHRQTAEAAGADMTLVKGILAARLIERIESLLASQN
jgi:DNA-binding NarL/FixJ family response regulator